jgi:hypothetical protein
MLPPFAAPRSRVAFARHNADDRPMLSFSWSLSAVSGLGGLAILAACGGGNGGGTSDAGAPSGEPAALTGITTAHNQVRAQVDTAGTSGPLSPLVWDDSLAATAAAWAHQCQDSDGDGLIDHNAGRSNGYSYYVGENIFASAGTATATSAVTAWTSETAHYHYATNTCDVDAVCGHYTQLVWRATQQVGCALASCPQLRFSSVVVCDYGPGGNVNNQKPY